MLEYFNEFGRSLRTDMKGAVILGCLGGAAGGIPGCLAGAGVGGLDAGGVLVAGTGAGFFGHTIPFLIKDAELTLEECGSTPDPQYGGPHF